jgi:muramoyltetrapeptide carboxypeptidase
VKIKIVRLLTPSNLNLPRALVSGDTLGIVAPASPFDRAAFDAGLQVLASMGFHLVVPEEIYATKGYLAGTDRRRAELIHRMFTDPEIHGIICARGGYGAMRILPLLDADLIGRHPKLVVGFSDITVLLTFLVERCGMVAFHGPTVTTLGNGDAETREQFNRALTDTTPIIVDAGEGGVIQSGQASGQFYCGNLTLFSHLVGTPFAPDFGGAVLLIEDQGEAPYRIDRMLTQLRLAGCVDRLAGLALGNFNDCGPVDQIHRIVADRLGDLKIPILAGFDVGHAGVNRTLPVGIPVRLDTNAGNLVFTVPALC